MPGSRRFRDEWLLRLVSPIAGVVPASIDVWREQGIEYLSQALMDAGVLTFESIASLIKNAYRIESVQIEAGTIDRAILSLVPESVCRKHDVIPVATGERSIDLAMANPLDTFASQDVAYATGREVVPLFCPPGKLRELAIEQLGPDEIVYDLLRKFESSARVEVIEREGGPDDELATVNDVRPPVVKLVDGIIAKAVRMGASDVHIEHEDHSSMVRYRIDGLLRNIIVLPRYVATGPVVARLKIMAALDVAGRFRPQDGRAKLRVDDDVVGLRVSTLPSRSGEKVVLRIVNERTAQVPLEQLGFRPALLKRLRAILGLEQGVVLVTGPTGSGKTTTLYAVLHELKSEQTNIVTIEDPIEYRLEGITQVQVNTKQGLHFASVLRSVLRQDPDVLLVGEIRDNETAAVATQAAMTGHLVFSTLHTNDAAGAISRLADMGVERFKVASAVIGVTAQRLVRRLCPVCSVPAPLDALPAPAVAAMRRLGLEPGHRAAVGCAQCGFTGYRKRFALMELLEITDGLRDRITTMDLADTQLAAAEMERGALETLEMDAVWHLALGHTTLEEVLPHIRVDALAAQVPYAAAESTTAASRRLRVVAVLGDPIWRALVPSALDPEDFDVQVTNSAGDALASIARNTPAAVVVGPSIEELGPVDLVGALRNVMGLASLPIVAIVSSENDAADLRAAGANEVLMPPVDARTIEKRIEAAMLRPLTWSTEEEIAAPPIPLDEPWRLAALHETKILDTPPEPRFDAITKAAQQRLGVPMAVISLVDADRQWFKSRQGVEDQQTARAISFCGHAINHPAPFVVPDARLDARFSNNPLVCGGPGIRFYAGYPITSPDGRKVGMFCVMDWRPRNISAGEKAILRELAIEVQKQLWSVEPA